MAEFSAQRLGLPWPASVFRDDDGALRFAGADIRELAAEFGTPAYLVDEDEFRGRARDIKRVFQAAFAEIGADLDVYYASKAFLSVAVARWITQDGLNLDTASGGELTIALAGGVPGENIGLHGNNKSDDELRLALNHSVGRIVVDSLAEVHQVVRIAQELGVQQVPVMVRLTTGVHAGGHEYISTAHEDQKFGLSIAAGAASSPSPAWVALEEILRHPELRLMGVHSHIGSQIQQSAGFAAAAEAVLTMRAEFFAATGHLLAEVDLGGGFGIAYLPGEVPMDLEIVAKEMAQAVLAMNVNDAGEPLPLPRFSIEPGRVIAGPAGITVYEVGTVKQVRASEDLVRTYVSVDGGMSDNIRPALYGAHYHAVLANRQSAAEPMLARVVGKHCESGDIVVHEVQLPSDIQAGDLLAVAATGAYGRAMSSNYNMLTRPPVIAVQDGSGRVLIRRETYQDFLSLDQG